MFLCLCLVVAAWHSKRTAFNSNTLVLKNMSSEFSFSVTDWESSVRPGARRLAGGGEARWRAAANLCQQTGLNDGLSCIRAGGESQPAHHQRSHVAGAGLLSTHRRGSAGRCNKHCLQTHQAGDRMAVSVATNLLTDFKLDGMHYIMCFNGVKKRLVCEPISFNSAFCASLNQSSSFVLSACEDWLYNIQTGYPSTMIDHWILK